MIIELFQDLETVDFKTNKEAIKKLKPSFIIDTHRDFEYTLNVNTLKEGILHLTIYIIHQCQHDGNILVSYIGLIKAFLIDLYDLKKDRKDLLAFIELNASVAYNIVTINEPAINIDLKKNLKSNELCDKMILSLKRLGFYND